MNYSCYGCQQRCVGCHAGCEKFQHESAKAAAVREAIHNAKKLDGGLIEDAVKAHDNFVKRRHYAACGW